VHLNRPVKGQRLDNLAVFSVPWRFCNCYGFFLVFEILNFRQINSTSTSVLNESNKVLFSCACPRGQPRRGLPAGNFGFPGISLLASVKLQHFSKSTVGRDFLSVSLTSEVVYSMNRPAMLCLQFIVAELRRHRMAGRFLEYPTSLVPSQKLTFTCKDPHRIRMSASGLPFCLDVQKKRCGESPRRDSVDVLRCSVTGVRGFK